jgi:hypothetical protein
MRFSDISEPNALFGHQRTECAFRTSANRMRFSDISEPNANFGISEPNANFGISVQKSL